jgi:flavin reductase (DIM6/NTAB) family NADH-FMN oxidoreductase RutF
MKKLKKVNFDVNKIRRLLEPGPVILVSSAHGGARDIMTMGWRMILGDGSSLVGCIIWDQYYSRGLMETSGECVINAPTFDLIDAVIGVGNTHTPETDKFAKFGLAPA